MLIRWDYNMKILGQLSRADVAVVLICILFLAMTGYAADSLLREYERRVACGSNLKALGTAQVVYANDYQDEFAVQGVRFLGVEECRPCYWMDQAVGTGAESWLKGQGGLRAKILSDGWLKLSSQVEVLIELGERAAQKSAGGD